MNPLAPLEAGRSTGPKGFESEPFCLQGNVLYFEAVHAIEDFERVDSVGGTGESLRWSAVPFQGILGSQHWRKHRMAWSRL